MYSQPISVRELREHWVAIEALKEGEGLIAVPISCMPPWEVLCNELDWQSHHLESGYFGHKHFGYHGVYRLIALAEDGDTARPAKLNRVCGQDVTGTLYIGKAGALHARLNQFRRSMTTYEDSHGAAGMLKAIPRLKLPPSRLAIALMFTGRFYGGVESDLIKAYMNTFGDTPPLNYRR